MGISNNLICFINFVPFKENPIMKICNQANLFSFSNINIIEYYICNYINKKFDDIKYINTSNNIENNIIEFIKDIKKIKVIIGYKVSNQINSIIKTCICNKISFDISKHIIIDIYDWNYESINNMYLNFNLGSSSDKYINKLKKILLYYYNLKILS